MLKVLVFGTFDHLHPGHRFLLTEASSRGDLHVVIARDQNVEKIKGHVPDQSEVDRLHVIQQTFPSSHPVLGDPDDFLVPVDTIRNYRRGFWKVIFLVRLSEWIPLNRRGGNQVFAGNSETLFMASKSQKNKHQGLE